MIKRRFKINLKKGLEFKKPDLRRLKPLATKEELVAKKLVPKDVEEPKEGKFKFLKYSDLHFEVDPIQDAQIKEACARNSVFAEMLFRDKTELFYKFIDYKTKYREVIGVEIKGGTRSGKSTMGIAICKYIASRTGIPFEFENICANEIEYLQKVKSGKFPDNSVFLIDEQTETHTGVGCLTAGQLIYTSNGLKKIEEIKEGDKVLSLNKKGKTEYKSVLKIWKRKHKGKLYEIRTIDGSILKLTPEHPILVLKPNLKYIWKKAEELDVGEYIVSIRKYTAKETKRTLNEDEAVIIGLIIGDGSVPNCSIRKSYCVNFSKKDYDLHLFLEKKVKKLFPNTIIRRYTYKGGEGLISNHKSCYETYYKSFLNSKEFRRWIEKYIPVGKKSEIVEIPKEILNSNKKIKAKFLSGLFSTDGSVSFMPKKKPKICYSSKSEKLVRQIKNLLVEFGIRSQIYETKLKYDKGGYYILYQLSICGSQSIKNFKQIGFIQKRKKEIYKKVLEIVEKKKPLGDIIPYYVLTRRCKNCWRYNLPEKIKEKIDDICFKKIKEIKIKETKENVYDITVEDNHNFVCDSLIISNSYAEMQILQDMANIIAKKCLTGDTKIILVNGKKTRIDRLPKSPKTFEVLSYNIPNQKIEKKLAWVVETGKKDIYEVRTKSGKVVYATADHDFIIKTKNGFIKKELRYVKIGERVFLKDKNTDEIVSIKKVGKEDTFDISVAENHNFFLGNGILISNCYHSVWCLEKGTPIKIVEGNRVTEYPIEQLLDRVFLVQSFDFDKMKVVVDEAICNFSGKKPLKEIELIDGRTVRATDEHKFFVKRNGKIIECKVKDLKTGDELLTF